MKKLVLSLLLANLVQFEASSQAMTFYSREQIKGLPKSRFIVADVGFQSQIVSQLDYSGNKKNLSDNINRSISFKDITEDDPKRENQLIGLFAANNISQEDSAGKVSGQIDSFVDGHVPVIGYGLTDKTSVIFSLPLIHFTVLAKHQFVQSNTTKKFINQLNEEDQMTVAQDFQAAFDNSLESRLYRAGYNWNPYVDRKMLGDLQVTFLNQLKEKDAFTLSFVIPTATPAAKDDIYQLKGGEKKWGLSTKYTNQIDMAPGLKLTNSLENLFYFPAEQMRRLYLSSGEDLKEGLDENTKIEAVDQLKYQIQARYEFPTWVSFTLGLNWQYRSQEIYSGDKYEQAVYDLNSAQSAQELSSAFVAMDLNSIQSFLAGNFLIPVALEISGSFPIQGKNAMSEPLYQLQGSMFF